MVDDDAIHSEMAALRAQIRALQAASNRQPDMASPQTTTPVERTAEVAQQATGPAVLSDQFRELEQAIHELAETIEAEVAERPVVSIGAAFLLGILIGRSMAR